MSLYNKMPTAVSICALAGVMWQGWNDYVTYKDEVQALPQKYSEFQKPRITLNEEQCTTYCQSLSDSLSSLNLPSHVNPKTLQSALEFLNTQKGRELVSNMRSNVKFTIDMNRTDNGGYYNDHFREICLTQTLNYGQNLSEDEKQGEYADTLFHELYHAYQYQQGLYSTFGLSPEQFMTAEKLFEAEAMVQGRLEGVIQKYGLRKDKQNMDIFMMEGELREEDYTVSSHHFAPSSANNATVSSENLAQTEKHLRTKRELTPEMALYDQLKTGTSLDVATQQAAAVMMKHYIGYDIPQELTYWQQYYDKHGLGALQCEAKQGRVSSDGNETAYNDILKYYETKYGLKRDEIDHTGGIHADHQSLFQKAVKNLDESGHLISMQNIIEKDTEKAQDKLWNNLKGRIGQLIGILGVLSLLHREDKKQKEQGAPSDNIIPQQPVIILQETPVLTGPSHLSQTLGRISVSSSDPYITRPVETNRSHSSQLQSADYIKWKEQEPVSSPKPPIRSVSDHKEDNAPQPQAPQIWAYNSSTSR